MTLARELLLPTEGLVCVCTYGWCRINHSMYLVLSSICCLAYNRSLRTNLLWPEGSPWKGRIFLVTLKHVLAMECCKNFTDVNWREAQSESKCSFLGQNIGCSHGEPLYPEMVRALTKGIITITCLGAVQHRKACGLAKDWDACGGRSPGFCCLNLWIKRDRPYRVEAKASPLQLQRAVGN